MQKRNVIIIEDEEDIAELISYQLEKNAFKTKCCFTAKDGLALINSNPPDLLLLDLMLPDKGGYEVCRIIRENPKLNIKKLPIIMLTAKADDFDVALGLELGADDYIVKPFNPKVLISRINAVLRRYNNDEVKSENHLPQKTIFIDDLQINPSKREVLLGSESIKLTETEFKLLYLLSSRPGLIFSREQIIDAVRSDGAYITDRAVDVQVTGLRKKLGDKADLIETVRGVGYKFKDKN